MGEAKKRGCLEQRIKEAKPKTKKMSAAKRNQFMAEANSAAAQALIAMTLTRLIARKRK